MIERDETSCIAVPMTADAPGAVAIVQVHGDEVELARVVRELCDAALPDVHAMRLVRFRQGDGAVLDEGVVARIDARVLQFMPHGGPRIRQLLLQRLSECGVMIESPRATSVAATMQFPEAHDNVESLMLETLAKAASPLAVDLLLDQPRRWRVFEGRMNDDDRARSARLNRLITPPLVVLAGPPNVGKSTLSNALLGRSMSIAADQPGTTRDYTTGLIDLAGLVVRWHDTPGLRASDDAIEREAIGLAQQVFAQANLIIAMTDMEHDWPDLPEGAHLWVINKIDRMPASLAARKGALEISAATGANVEELVHTVREALVPQRDLENERPWMFDARLVAKP